MLLDMRNEKKKEKKEVEISKQKNAMLKYLHIKNPEATINFEVVNSEYQDESSTGKGSDTSEVANKQDSDNGENMEDEAIQGVANFENIDISLWPKHLTSDMQKYFLLNKPSSNISFICTSKMIVEEGGKEVTRSLKEHIFFRIKANGEKINREWLVYSTESKAIYCYVCKLFSTKSTSLTEGFRDWKNAKVRVQEHEHSAEHKKCIEIFIARSTILGRIDSVIEKAYEEEKKYWRKVLQRVVATIKFLAKYSLAFRGSDEKFSSLSTGSGNYIGALEYLAEFDEFIASHIKKYGSVGKGNVSYLSSTVCDEFIELINKKMIKMFQTEVQDAKYFSIIIDSTPDITHVDQLTFVLRYITKDGNPVERFFGFLPIYSHTGEALEKVVLEHLEALDLKIADCRGQSYDNAANMSGKYNGVQSRIKQHSETAHFVPCAAHTLNLIGNSAADSCLQATIYYHLLENIYAFFAASTHRWNILELTFLENRKHLTVKRICDTRWSSRAEAVKAIRTGYNEIRKALFDISEDECQKRLVQIEAKELQKKMNSLEFILMTIIWDKIVSRMNACNKSLQEPSINLSITVNILESLLQFIQDLRNKFEEIEDEAMQISEIKAYADTGSRQRKRIRFFDEDQNENKDIHLIGQAAFRVNCFNFICDKLCTELKTRCSSYKHLNEMFGIFSLNIDSMSKNISEYTAELKKCYKNDINITELDDELLQFLLIAKNENINSPLDMYSFIKKNNIVSTFPNTEILLRIYLTIPVSNATGERSFSVLKRVKNYLRNSIGQQKLSSLSVLNIEQETLNQLDCEDIIDRFSEMKLRKKRF